MKKIMILLYAILFGISVLNAQTVKAFEDASNNFYDVGNYDSAFFYAKKVEPLIVDSFSKKSINYAWFVGQFYSFIYEKKNNTDSAIYWYTYSLHLFEELHDTTSYMYGETLNNYGSMMNNISFIEALPYIKKAVVLFKTIKKDSAAYAASLNSLGTNYNYSGEYTNSERMYSQSLQILSLLPPDSVEITSMPTILYNLGNAYYKLGNFAASEEYFKKAIINLQKIPQLKYLYVQISNSLGDMYFETKKIDKADSIYTTLYHDPIWNNKNILQNEFFLLKPLVIMGLGNVRMAQEKYSEAENLFKQAVLITENTSLPPLVKTSSLTHLALLYTFIKKYKQADSIYERIIRTDNIANKDRYHFTAMYVNYCINLLQMNENEKAAIKTKKLIASLLEDMHTNFSGMTEEEQLNYVHSLGTFINLAFSTFTTNFSKDQQLVKYSLNQLLQLKGIIISYQARRLQNLRISSDTELAELNRHWLIAKQILYNEYRGITALHINKDSLEKVADDINKKISLKTGTWLDDKNDALVDEISKRLKKNEAVIEYVHYVKIQTKKDIYGAFIMVHDKEPEYIELCTNEQLLSCLKEKNKQAVTIQSQVVNGPAIYNLLWKPMVLKLQNLTTVYYSPDGLLNYFSFDDIITAPNVFLMNQKNMILLSSTKNLLDNNNLSNNKIDKAVLWGEIDCSEEAYLASNSNKINTTSKNELLANKGLPDDIKKGAANKKGFSAWKDEELPVIAEMAKKKNLHPSLFTKENATEENFKDSSATFKGVLHISSHGFYANQINMAATSGVAGKSFSSQINPLLRCGLVLNGGNYAWLNKPPFPNKEDGILTGYEIAIMDLSKVDLVVLSACETGLGDIDAGSEGVIGLQRAFKLAGVHKMLLTLWEVGVTDTKIFMTLFYKDLLNGVNAATALRNAKIEMAKNYPPLSWAGFVLID